VFGQLTALELTNDQLGQLAGAMGQVGDPRTAGPLWDLLTREPLTAEAGGTIYSSLWSIYFGPSHYDLTEVSLPRRRFARAETKQKVASGSEWQQVVGLALLFTTVPDETAETAKSIFEDSNAAELARRDAHQIMLKHAPKIEGPKLAAAARKHELPPIRKAALAFLATGENSVAALREYVPLRNGGEADSEYFSIVPGDKPSVPAPPAGVDGATLTTFLGDADPEITAYAGYLLCLLGDSKGLDPLLRHWRQHAKAASAWSRLVYQAISYLDDDSQTPVLEEIYEQLETYDVRDFYWTIRIIHGPQALALRKRIRDEQGMEALR
jgi:hypothetical protein